LEGEYTLEDARRWYEEGGFTVNRRPKARFLDDMGSGDGSTFYVGRRENGKLFRAYEKGKQLGNRESKWVRFELELKSRDRVIPLDVVTNPGGYLSGAYPCLSWIDEVQERVKTLSKVLKVSYEKVKGEAKKAYGRLINFMVSAGFSADEIVGDLINKDGFPRRMEVPLFSMGYL
jgi:phage replication initiation protein